MARPTRALVAETEDTEALLNLAQDLFVSRRHPVDTRDDLRLIVQRAYSLGYDAAHQDHVDGNIG